MKVIAFNGSPRKQGNTCQSIQVVFEELQRENIETELIHLGGTPVHPCNACMKCYENKDNACVIKNDDLNSCIKKMIEADGIIIGSPVYFSNVTAEVKAFMDRAGLVARANNCLLKRKIGAPVVVMRRAGATFTFSAINFFFFANEMIVPGSSYWNLALGRAPGEIHDDEEGITTFKTLGQNMAWLLKTIQKSHHAD